MIKHSKAWLFKAATTTKQSQQYKEKVRLKCIGSSELIDKRAYSIRTQAANEYFNDLVADSTVTIERIKDDRHLRTITELSKGV